MRRCAPIPLVGVQAYDKVANTGQGDGSSVIK